MINIDKDIPVPDKQAKYPFSTMKVGDSFFVPNKRSRQFGTFYKKYAPKKFTMQTRTEKDVKGTRVWRIA